MTGRDGEGRSVHAGYFNPCMWRREVLIMTWVDVATRHVRDRLPGEEAP